MHEAMIKLEVSALAQDLADRLPAFVDACVAETGCDDARYGAKAAFVMLFEVVCERFKEKRTYFDFPEFEA